MLSKLKGVSKIALAAELGRFAYNHRQEALELLKKVRGWRGKRKSTDKSVSLDALPEPERIKALEARLDEMEAYEQKQAELIESMAEDVARSSELLEALAERNRQLVRMCLLSILLSGIAILSVVLYG